MTVYTADHRAVPACVCVRRHLVEADRLLTEARQLARDATLALEDPEAACRAVEMLTRAGQNRIAAADEVRAALDALDNPPVPTTIADAVVP